MIPKIASGLVLTLVTSSALAYEQFTHAAMTRAAVSRSALQAPDNRLVKNLDLLGVAPLDSLGRYFDLVDPFQGALGAVLRTWQIYENDMLQIFGPTFDSSIGDWVTRGAIREDDNPSEQPPTPQDVSPGLKRPLHHFFDPANNRRLTGSLYVLIDSDIHKNPDWALGSRDSFGQPNTPEVGRRNHFSVVDAREAMFRALTLKWKGQDGAYQNLALGNVDPATQELWRKAYWTTTFRALGDAMHLIQDMAQPQHTRNEAHSGMLCPGAFFCLGGHTSVYEKYIDARARRQPKFRSLAPFNAEVVLTPSAIDFGSYQVPTFLKFTDFWSTSPGPGSATGQGLADYSNRGFFTAKYNLGTTEYQNPSNSSSDYAIEAYAPKAWDQTPIPNGAPVYIYKGNVPDTVRGSPTSDVALTSYGLWDQFMQSQGAQPSYSLNRINYDAMADLLIPRAVAYSAGFLDFFFRGQLKINPPDTGFYAIVDHSQFAPGQPNTPTDVLRGFRGFDKIKLKLTNTTADITPPNGVATPQPMTGGTLVAVVKFRRNTCYDDLLANWPADAGAAQQCVSPTEEIVVSDPQDRPVAFSTPDNPNGDEVTFKFSARQIPINAWSVALQVVYRGKLGAEDDAVVVATKNISEPNFVSFMNTTDYVILDSMFYKPADLAARQALFDQVNPGCKSGTPGNYILFRACYNVTDDFVFTAGSSNVNIIAAAETVVAPRRFARFAVLGDSNVNLSFSWQTGAVSCWLFLADPLTLSPYVAQLDAQGNGGYGRPTKLRGVPQWNSVTCYIDIGNTVTPVQNIDLGQLDALNAPSETTPTPFTITGW